MSSDIGALLFILGYTLSELYLYLQVAKKINILADFNLTVVSNSFLLHGASTYYDKDSAISQLCFSLHGALTEH